ncbi:MAG: ribbon-helix-helix domain-containing protein, partial [Pseudolabrys sp.]
KRSVVIDGHKMSVSLEESFWTDLKEIAHTQHTTISKVIEASTRSAKATCRQQYGCLYSIKSASMGILGIFAPYPEKSQNEASKAEDIYAVSTAPPLAG